MNKTLRIVGKRSESRRVSSGMLRRDVLGMLELDIEVDMSNLPPWLDKLIGLLEEQYTPRRPSIRDQVHFMAALASAASPAYVPETVSEAMHYLGAPLGLRFHEEPELKFFSDRPDAGDQMCICSYCEEVIKKEHGPPIRFFDKENNTEARLHLHCFDVCKKFALIPENTS